MFEIINYIIIFLFVVFMIFILGGYHKAKSSAREDELQSNKDKP